MQHSVPISTLRRRYNAAHLLKLMMNDDPIIHGYVQALHGGSLKLRTRRDTPLIIQWRLDTTNRRPFDPVLYEKLVRCGLYDIYDVVYIVKRLAWRSRSTEEKIFIKHYTTKVLEMIFNSIKWRNIDVTAQHSIIRNWLYQLPDLRKQLCRCCPYGFTILPTFSMEALTSNIPHEKLPIKWFRRAATLENLMNAACKWGVGFIAAKTIYANNINGARILMKYFDAVCLVDFLIELSRLSKINFRFKEDPNKISTLLNTVEDVVSKMLKYGCRALTVIYFTNTYNDDLCYQAALEYIKYGNVPWYYIGGPTDIFSTGNRITDELKTRIRDIIPTTTPRRKRYAVLSYKWRLKN